MIVHIEYSKSDWCFFKHYLSMTSFETPTTSETNVTVKRVIPKMIPELFPRYPVLPRSYAGPCELVFDRSYSAQTKRERNAQIAATAYAFRSLEILSASSAILQQELYRESCFEYLRHVQDRFCYGFPKTSEEAEAAAKEATAKEATAAAAVALIKQEQKHEKEIYEKAFHSREVQTDATALEAQEQKQDQDNIDLIAIIVQAINHRY